VTTNGQALPSLQFGQPSPAPASVAELQVQPVRVINILKQRLTEEISKTALLEAALAESQERERALRAALGEQEVQAGLGDA
jgi:hypothetical protein